MTGQTSHWQSRLHRGPVPDDPRPARPIGLVVQSYGGALLVMPAQPGHPSQFTVAQTTFAFAFLNELRGRVEAPRLRLSPRLLGRLLDPWLGPTDGAAARAALDLAKDVGAAWLALLRRASRP